MSSREVHIRPGEPSGAMRYTSEPPLDPRPGKESCPVVAGAVGAMLMLSPGACGPVLCGAPVVRLIVGGVIPELPAVAPRFSPTPAAYMFPPRSTASAVISFLGALYSTKPSPPGEMR